jgi:hypothetical protein
MLHGSYPPDDVTFLLKLVHLDSTDVAEKERLIQSGQRHYSEMITREQLPSKKYLHTFYHALDLEKSRFARHLLLLAELIARARRNKIALVSLARAGTPVGVLLTRILRQFHARDVTHYSISIIRDRGIDEAALGHILERHGPQAIVFVDGWTGKGVIARELHQAITTLNARQQLAIDPGLFVVADLCGAAAVAASTDDYLIPSCVLGATISGLVSRSILNDAVIGPGDFHGCLYYRDFEPHDLSVWFVETILAAAEQIAQSARPERAALPTAEDFVFLQLKNRELVSNIQKRFGVADINHIKPGIGEATRVLLRRVPHLLLLREPDRPEVRHLQLLAQEKKVPVQIDPNLPYLATALIRELE